MTILISYLVSIEAHNLLNKFLLKRFFCCFFKRGYATRTKESQYRFYSNFLWWVPAEPEILWKVSPGNTKGGSITVLLTSCLTGLG
jgi:hypothetical protein